METRCLRRTQARHRWRDGRTSDGEGRDESASVRGIGGGEGGGRGWQRAGGGIGQARGSEAYSAAVVSDAGASAAAASPAGAMGGGGVVGSDLERRRQVGGGGVGGGGDWGGETVRARGEWSGKTVSAMRTMAIYCDDPLDMTIQWLILYVSVRCVYYIRNQDHHYRLFK